ncbi:MAG: hypothetical protein K0S65_6824, partial [Labilithrix sp.]|nr:hypothetical protein [Labilithrix sp.]
MAFFALLGVFAAVACATEGDAGHEEPPVPGPPADAAGTADASDAADAGMDASPCSTSGLCTVSVGLDTRTNVVAISGSSAKDVWAVGSTRTVLHFDGAAWEKTTIEADASAFTMRAVWLGGEGDVWIADGPAIRHSTGWEGPNVTAWTSIVQSQPPSAISGKGGTVAVGSQQGFAPVAICSGWGDG